MAFGVLPRKALAAHSHRAPRGPSRPSSERARSRSGIKTGDKKKKNKIYIKRGGRAPRGQRATTGERIPRLCSSLCRRALALRTLCVQRAVYFYVYAPGRAFLTIMLNHGSTKSQQINVPAWILLIFLIIIYLYAPEEQKCSRGISKSLRPQWTIIIFK